jgi:hypothetical protein
VSVAYVRVKKFDQFQHYKDRCPPWIKLHRGVLTDYALSGLPDAAKAHLMLIWLLASECDNRLPADPQWIANRIGATEPIDLDLLLDAGFLELADDRRDATRSDWPSRYVSRQMRETVLERDGHKCVACGATETLEIDHVTPISKGGKSETGNLQTLCRPCNRRKRVKGSVAAEQIATQVSCPVEESRAETEAEKRAVSKETGDAASETITEHTVMGVLRKYAYVPDGKDPQPGAGGRDRDFMRSLVGEGHDLETIAKVIHGIRILADRGELPGFVRKGQKFTLRALSVPKWSGRDFWERALSAYYAAGPDPPSSGIRGGEVKSIGEVKLGHLKAAG